MIRVNVIIEDNAVMLNVVLHVPHDYEHMDGFLQDCVHDAWMHYNHGRIRFLLSRSIRIKGKPSKYVSSNKNRRMRMRKKSAIIERMDLFEINYHNASMLKMKQPHNSNGKPRPMKYMLDDRLIQPVSSIIW